MARGDHWLHQCEEHSYMGVFDRSDRLLDGLEVNAMWVGPLTVSQVLHLASFAGSSPSPRASHALAQGVIKFRWA